MSKHMQEVAASLHPWVRVDGAVEDRVDNVVKQGMQEAGINAAG